MATLFNDQRVLGVHLVDDGTVMHNGLPVIGVVAAEEEVMFAGDLRTLGVDVLTGDETLHNDQPVLGAVLIEDGRTLYNGQLVIPVYAVSGELGGDDGELSTFEAAVIDLIGERLKAWWDLDNPKYLWADTDGTTPAETSGAIAMAIDKIGGHEAVQSTGANRPVLSASRGALFDGVNDLLVAADHADLRPTAQITVYCWIHPTTNGPIFFKEGSSLGYGTWNTNPRLYIRVNGAWRDSGGNLSPTLNQWQSIALTHDGSATKGWIDHVAVWTPSAAAGAIQQGTTDLQIGRNATQGFSGRLGGIIICNEALSEAELADLDTLFAAEYAS